MAAGAPYSFIRGVVAVPGSGPPYSFIRGVVQLPGSGAPYSFIRGTFGSFSGPVVSDALATLSSEVSGPVLTGPLSAAETAHGGPGTDDNLATLPDAFGGPVLTGTLSFVPPVSGPVLDGPIGLLPPDAGSGTVLDGPLELAAPPPPIPPPAPPAPPPIPIPEAVLSPDALVVTPSSVVLGGDTISTGLASETGDALNKYGVDVFRSHAVRQAGGTSKNFGRFTGPAYQFGPSWAATLGPKSDLEVVFTSVINILTTPLGSIPYDPFIGSDVPNLVFEPNDAITQGLIRYFTERDLKRQEPRARVLFVRTYVPVDEPYTVVVTVAFQIVGDPEGRVFSAPVAFNTLSLAA